MTSYLTKDPLTPLMYITLPSELVAWCGHTTAQCPLALAFPTASSWPPIAQLSLSPSLPYRISSTTPQLHVLSLTGNTLVFEVDEPTLPHLLWALPQVPAHNHMLAPVST